VTKLKTTVLRKSKGAKIAEGDTIFAWYVGKLLKNGDQFDANYDFKSFSVPTPSPNYVQLNGKPLFTPQQKPLLDFVVGAGTVIPGMDKAFKKNRRVGEIVEITIPAELGYGEAGSGESIPPNSDLVFTVEVVASRKNANSDPKFAQLKHLGVNTKKLGLTSEKLSELNAVKIGLDSADRLIGDNSKDLLVGLGGNDNMVGAGGADVLIGGGGKNRFIYTDINDSPAGKGLHDSIYGFGNKDKINLRALNEKLSFIGAQKFSGAAGDVRFKKGLLEMDLDGDGSADFSIALPGTKALKDSHLLL